MVLSCITLLCVVGLFASPGMANDEPLVAVVNGVEISLVEFFEALEREAGQHVLQQLIAQEIIRQKQEQTGTVVEEEEFEDFYQRLIDQLGGPNALMQVLWENRMTEEQLRESLRLNLLISKLSKLEVDVTDEEVQTYFESNRARFDEPEKVKAAHILVPSQELAHQLLIDIQQGADFAELAAKHSSDPGSKNRGGDLGFFSRGQMVPVFETAAFETEIGEHAIVESQFGWHIILVTDRVEAIQAELEDFYERVKDTLLSQRALTPNEYVEYLMSKAEIKILRDGY